MQLFNHLFNSRYEESEWGWDEKDKLREMIDDAAWYLVATSDDNKPVAFSHFRFDVILQLLSITYLFKIKICIFPSRLIMVLLFYTGMLTWIITLLVINTTKTV